MDGWIVDLMKVYGPLGLGWPLFIWLLKSRFENDKIDVAAKITLATTLDKHCAAFDRVITLVDSLREEIRNLKEAIRQCGLKV